MKKLLAVLLSLCLVVGMLPMMAFAENEETPEVYSAPASEPEELNDITELENNDTVDNLTEFETAISGTGDIVLGADIIVTGSVTIGRNVTIKSADGGKYRIGGGFSVANGTVKLDGIVLGANVLVDNGELQIEPSTTVESDVTLSRYDDGAITGLGSGYSQAIESNSTTGRVYYTNNIASMGIAYITGSDGVKVVYSTLESAVKALEGTSGTVVLVKDTDENFELPANVTLDTENNATAPNVTKPGDGGDGGDDGDEEVDPTPVYYSVSFDVTPYWADVVVTDSTGNTVKPDRNGQYWLEAGKEYDYTVSAYGFISETGDIGLTNAIKVKLDQSDKVVVWPTSHGDVYFSYLSHGWVAVYVEPDSGYYLDDLTIYRVGYGAIDYGKWDNGVYYFRMRAGQQYIIDADFASAPSEYRVYVDSSILHGDVSVDTVYAEEGEWVYITVDPDVGYRLYNLTVTRPSGNTVKVEHVRDNVYRFSMPGVRVTVDAEFIRTVTPFTDVRLADWFYEYVSFAYRYGLMEGINSYQFAPDATATRAMVVQILYRMSGEPAVSYGSGFTDVASNAWYADAIAWAARNNIVNGTSAATFDPNAPVTREQFATMLYRYARYRGFNTSLTANILSYYDVNQVSEYAFEALQWACAEGIVNGTSTGYLTPQGNATRAQLAAMLMRFCNEYFDL